MKNIAVSEKATAEMHQNPKVILHISLQEIFTEGFIESGYKFRFFSYFFLLLNGTFHGYLIKFLDRGFSL